MLSKVVEVLVVGMIGSFVFVTIHWTVYQRVKLSDVPYTSEKLPKYENTNSEVKLVLVTSELFNFDLVE